MKKLVFFDLDLVPEGKCFEDMTDEEILTHKDDDTKVVIYDSLEDFARDYNEEDTPNIFNFGCRVIDFDKVGQERNVRITFRSEVYIKGKNLQEVARKWERMELFSDEANDCSACQIELNSVEDMDADYKDIKSEFEMF